MRGYSRHLHLSLHIAQSSPRFLVVPPCAAPSLLTDAQADFLRSDSATESRAHHRPAPHRPLNSVAVARPPCHARKALRESAGWCARAAPDTDAARSRRLFPAHRSHPALPQGQGQGQGRDPDSATIPPPQATTDPWSSVVGPGRRSIHIVFARHR
ncbi:hypothetical protein B0H15DRAFT_406283 [Mycena belliarum]|uniref:Uncharacterized protein n=1 Tax=Mycena belliarum TaxID=1033014 RepID=A0AAD6U422_9AGAR|nr:hypothetical protein B0H15DRAFT_406283 [Mycena belliae]